MRQCAHNIIYINHLDFFSFPYLLNALYCIIALFDNLKYYDLINNY